MSVVETRFMAGFFVSKEEVENAMLKHKGIASHAARSLGMPWQTFRRRLIKYNLRHMMTLDVSKVRGPGNPGVVAAQRARRQPCGRTVRTHLDSVTAETVDIVNLLNRLEGQPRAQIKRRKRTVKNDNRELGNKSSSNGSSKALPQGRKSF